MVSRGQKDKVDNFINDFQAMFHPYGSPDANGNRMHLQLNVRPVQLWELAFPKEHFKLVLNTIAPTFNNTDGRQREMKLLQNLRFLLNAKKIPLMDLTNEPRRIVRGEAVGTYPFAIKDDQVWKEGEKNLMDNGKPIPKELIGHERI